MLVKQISVFLENKSGRLAEVTKILGEKDIDISALSIADTTDFGILRLIVNNPEKAEQILKEKNFAVSCTNVIAIAVADKPGGLAEVLQILDNYSIGIEYMYAFVGKNKDEALVIIRVEDLIKAVEVLNKNKIRVLSANEVYNL
ncbi:MAG TPA: ACT domain-containing protein [Desulfitobacteriaceae bacterium]|jgi:hypothetical protein|nr:ACT domain-containing protein [Desulfitobacteriaceae bacterium]